ncbi:MAG: ABC transporter substrate-binding protein [Candidatus Latescibacterota bacterium]|jgi:raffinose/stachyose/melibiose transport system substrate-binding protein
MTDKELEEAAEEKTGRRINWSSLSNYVAVIFLIISFSVSLWRVYRVQEVEQAEGVATIRVVHWQLEAGFREAFDDIARRFEKVYLEEAGVQVRIVQNAISERVYKQYVQTQGIGKTLPDLVQLGRDELGSVPRFFISNTDDVQRPNPYNKGTDLEDVPWMDTYLDGMLGSIDQTDLEYYGASSSTASTRLFYNEDLLKEVLGTDEPPTEYREFLAACKRFDEWAKERGRTDLTPVAASRYQANVFRSMRAATLFELMLENDRDFDGNFGQNDEVLFAYAAGDFDYRDPRIRADEMTVANLTRYFSPGFMAMDRMEAQFRFTQGKALFCASGSWDAMSFHTQVDFPMGVIDFPFPTRDDPEFGQYVRGRISEADAPAVFRLAVSKFSEHPDITLRFLQYLTSRASNQRFNQLARWPPVIKGAEPHPQMRPFMRTPEGFWTGEVNRVIGAGPAATVYTQARWELVEHKVDFDGFADMMEREMPRAMAQEFERLLNTEWEERLAQEMSLSHQLAGFSYGATWGDEAPSSERVQSKMVYLWEMRMRRYRNSYRLMQWQNLLDEGHSKAQDIQQYIKIDLDRN